MSLSTVGISELVDWPLDVRMLVRNVFLNCLPGRWFYFGDSLLAHTVRCFALLHRGGSQDICRTIPSRWLPSPFQCSGVVGISAPNVATRRTRSSRAFTKSLNSASVRACCLEFLCTNAPVCLLCSRKAVLNSAQVTHCPRALSRKRPSQYRNLCCT